MFFYFFFSSRRRHTRLQGDWSSDVCSSDLVPSRSRNSWARRDSGGAADGNGETSGADGDEMDGARIVMVSPAAPSTATKETAMTDRRRRAPPSAWKLGKSILART